MKKKNKTKQIKTDGNGGDPHEDFIAVQVMAHMEAFDQADGSELVYERFLEAQNSPKYAAIQIDKAVLLKKSIGGVLCRYQNFYFQKSSKLCGV